MEAASSPAVIDLAAHDQAHVAHLPEGGLGHEEGRAPRRAALRRDRQVRRVEVAAPQAVQAPPETGSGWFRLFKRMDDDGSGKITYGELGSLVRRDLEVSTTELPDRRLWRCGGCSMP